MLADIAWPQTIQNPRVRPHVEINVVEPAWARPFSSATPLVR